MWIVWMRKTRRSEGEEILGVVAEVSEDDGEGRREGRRERR
jgi:hypothetical protein